MRWRPFPSGTGLAHAHRLLWKQFSVALPRWFIPPADPAVRGGGDRGASASDCTWQRAGVAQVLGVTPEGEQWGMGRGDHSRERRAGGLWAQPLSGRQNLGVEKLRLDRKDFNGLTGLPSGDAQGVRRGTCLPQRKLPAGTGHTSLSFSPRLQGEGGPGGALPHFQGAQLASQQGILLKQGSHLKHQGT